LLYQFEFDTFAPRDPWPLTPFQPPDAPQVSQRNPDDYAQRVDPAETMYLCDSLDYHAGRPNTDTLAPFDGPGAHASAGMRYSQQGAQLPLALLLGAHHLAKANILYADSHVSSDGLAPRSKRGTLVIASTFADYVGNPPTGNQFHAISTWCKFPDRLG